MSRNNNPYCRERVVIANTLNAKQYSYCIVQTKNKQIVELHILITIIPVLKEHLSANIPHKSAAII